MYMFYNIDLFDFTRCQMMMTVKFMQLGYNLYDGYIYSTSSTNATVQFDSNNVDSAGGGSGSGVVGSGVVSSRSNNNDISSGNDKNKAVSMRQQVYIDNMHRQVNVVCV